MQSDELVAAPELWRELISSFMLNVRYACRFGRHLLSILCIPYFYTFSESLRIGINGAVSLVVMGGQCSSIASSTSLLHPGEDRNSFYRTPVRRLVGKRGGPCKSDLTQWAPEQGPLVVLFLSIHASVKEAFTLSSVQPAVNSVQVEDNGSSLLFIIGQNDKS